MHLLAYSQHVSCNSNKAWVTVVTTLDPLSCTSHWHTHTHASTPPPATQQFWRHTMVISVALFIYRATFSSSSSSCSSTALFPVNSFTFANLQWCFFFLLGLVMAFFYLLLCFCTVCLCSLSNQQLSVSFFFSLKSLKHIFPYVAICILKSVTHLFI